MSHRLVLWTVLVAVCGVAAANKPVFDLSNSMRLLLLPTDTPVGSVIYKLRASDADDEYPLAFRKVNERRNCLRWRRRKFRQSFVT